MWLSNRRTFLLAGLATGACGFTPVYGPGGAGARLQSSIALPAPSTDRAFEFNRRFEARMGRGRRFDMELSLSSKKAGFGSTSTGSTTRYRLDGEAAYILRDAVTKVVLAEGKTTAFTGYSTTGSTVATLSAERDAYERLMVILADQVIDDLLLTASDLPA